ncbi:F0F1 ATP synthase subunit delta [Pseudomonadales bacterium]|nr:F0F1 ATP synthase subunit delta [Pseudomonadales bacterium]
MAELRTLARPYAKAAFQAASESDSLQFWADQLVLLGSISVDPKVVDAITSSTLDAASQVSTLVDLVGSDLSGAVNNFLHILAENKRLLLLPSVAELFVELKANLERSVEVNISTAFALDDTTETKLTQALKQKLQRDIQVHTNVDKSLLGGVVVRAGDIVIDGSVKGRLAKLAEAMSV